MIEMTKEQIEKIEQLSYARQRNLRVNAKEVTMFYNELFAPRKVSVTTCATCIRRRIQEMENLLKKYREEQEKLNKIEEEVVEEQPEQEVEEQPEEIKEEEVVEEENKKKKGGRPKKEEQKDDGHNEKVKEQTETAVEEGSTD